MAIDTRDKRFSILGLHQPVPSLLPHPNAAIGASDRAMLVFLYAGITLGVATISETAVSISASRVSAVSVTASRVYAVSVSGSRVTPVSITLGSV